LEETQLLKIITSQFSLSFC